MTAEQKALVSRAAALVGEPISSFVLVGARERADAVVSERAVTVVPADYFDRLLSTLDEADATPRLARAARTVQKHQRATAA